MSNNQPWYPQDDYQYTQPNGRQRLPDQRSSSFQNAAPDAVHTGQRLLAVYPPASATPTHHVSRHISNMTLTNAPTFPQPNLYNNYNTNYPPSNPAPYSDYDQQLRYLSSSQMMVDDSGYWDHNRNEAVRMLNGQTASSYNAHYTDNTQWTTQNPPSSFQTTPFAQSVFQRTTPSTAYPTPPPPPINPASSSLAYALGVPPVQSHPQAQTQTHITPPQPKVYQATESHAFYEDFLERKALQANPPLTNQANPPQIIQANPPQTMIAPVPRQEQIRPSTPPPSKPLVPDSSPDPLSLQYSVSPKAMTASVTPMKRKPIVLIESPSIKRLQALKESNHTSSQPKTPQAPRTSAPPTPSSRASSFSNMSTTSSNNVTPTHKRIVNLAYVAVPPSPWLTPTSSRKPSVKTDSVRSKVTFGDTPDLGGYGSEDDGPSSPTKRFLNDSVKSSARRTGDRDERGPLEKFTSLIEDVFEAEDTLPSELEASDLNHEFFSQLSNDCTRPCLSSSIIRKLTKYIGHVARPTKRLRQAANGVLGTPRGKGRMTDVDTQILSRLLKILERSVKAGEDIDPFAYRAPPVSAKSSPKKQSTKKVSKPKKNERASRSLTPKGADEEEDVVMEDPKATPAIELSEDDFDKLTNLLEIARDSILAADCCIALLGSDRLTKQLYSEELITACLNTIKNQLTKILYAFVEASAESGPSLNSNPLLMNIVKNTTSSASSHRRQLGELFQALSAVIPRINNLINTETVAMSDSIIIQAVYIAIGPFFVVDVGGEADAKGKKENVIIKTLGKSAMRGLRLDALALIRSIFANHEDQRSWIIEEILTSLIKLNDTKQKAGQFRLRDGRAIRTVSALLMQLVQTSAHDVRIEAKKINKSRQNKFALRRQESFSESQQPPDEPFLDEIDQEELRLYGSGLDSATKAAKTIIVFLTQRSGKGKATKNSNEAEYRAIFDNLIDDLLVVLFWPEWPAASIILSIASKFMVSSLDDVKTSSQTDSNAAKTMALDHLGVIAARIRTSILKVQREPPSKKPLKPLDEIVSNVDLKNLNRFLEAHKSVASHVCKRSSEDQAYDSARELSAATLGQELAAALKQVHRWLESPGEDDDLNIKDHSKLAAFGDRLKLALREVWVDPSSDVFDVGSAEEVQRVDSLSEEIGTIQSLRNSFNPILSIIVMALDAPAIFMRTKALRALGQIVTSDASILANANVRRGIESHLLDSSPAVRDAAVELIGKYMIESPEVAGEYYQKIADRMADTGLSVRKRVIKLLKSYYPITTDQRRIEIATRMVLRLMDEDDTVKDLAIKTIEELWFPPTPLPSALKSSRTATAPINPRDNSALESKVSVIMGTSANFKDRQSPLEDVLHKIMVDKEGNEKTSLHARYAEICESLIDGLVDASDRPGFTVINCIRTVYLLTSAYPSILSGTSASTLLPYLKNATTTEELTTSDYLLKIFRVSIPRMPKTATKFGHELQAALQPMIIKPSGAGGVQLLQEAVGCMCTVVEHLTHDFVRLVNLLKSCNARLLQSVRRPAQELGPAEHRAMVILILIVALLAENCKFDTLRKENTNLGADLDTISKGPITEHIYNILLSLYEKYESDSLRGRVLQCLGFLFRAQPTLMTMERSTRIMDVIFMSSEEEEKGRMLKIIQDFLVSEAAKHDAQEKESTNANNSKSEVDMGELVGNTEGFADSGVSAAIVQRYLEHILEACLSTHNQIQSVAVDVLTFTVKQGLAHPLQAFPIIVALETSPISSISNRASALHTILHAKFPTIVNSRYTVSARKSFDYQKKITTGVVHGFRMQPTPIALLQRWYTHVREKRPVRQEFLKALVKIFQENPNYESSQDDVSYTRYMAENFATFDYKTLEEVLTVIKYLTSVLSTTGMQLLEIISPSHLLTHLHGSSSQPIATNPSEPPPTPDATSTEIPPPTVQADAKEYDRVPLMRTSVIIAIAMLLKAHLKALYSLSEDKCNKFVIGKKSAIGDRPATKRHDVPVSWDRLTYATTPLLTTEDADIQRVRFLEIWNADGLTAEPEDEEFL
ncbi:Protein rad9 [Psilocybe cubensis]|uniref:Protein rad9 n=2 Tax=Psilocybe cubensis TaxID=181762 RepID=A0ACB8GX25_PSICU|nr:Protein rad9 [Psilocybe cubensis]KAH9480188.1 Protein rad9 [Psilocybe cubensis]